MPTVAIDKVSVSPNRRPLKDEKVADLMESIKANGLLHPITVDQNFKLIAGLHRLTACKLLGFSHVECTIIRCDDANHARLAEIDENLIRSELDALERSDLWLERDRILEQMGLRAKPGDNQYRKRGGEIISPPVKTTLELAKEIGYTDRTFQQGKQIAKGIDPEVKAAIRGTSLAKSPTALLKVARAGSEERKRAELAEKAAQEAKAKQQQAESERQAKLAEAARVKQRELQIIALNGVAAEKKAKLATKNNRLNTQSQAAAPPATAAVLPTVQLGDEWTLDQHLVYCGDTTSSSFVECLPSNASLAIAVPSLAWDHDFLVNEARVVAVLRSEGGLHEFCHHHKMPFQFEFLLEDLYLAVFSHQTIAPPQKPNETQGIEGIVAYLISLYTNPGNFVIAPSLGHGEVLMACEKLKRVCFVGDSDPEVAARSIARWQNWTGKQAKNS